MGQAAASSQTAGSGFVDNREEDAADEEMTVDDGFTSGAVGHVAAQEERKR